jgi:hypothetical protein
VVVHSTTLRSPRPPTRTLTKEMTRDPIQCFLPRRLGDLRGLVALMAISGSLVVPSTAGAIEPEVTSDTAAQFYDVRSPTGETILQRRRLTTTLGVSAYDIIDHPADSRGGPEINFRARLRYDADYGASPQESDSSNFNRFVPGFSSGPVDLMYGYIEGRRFLNGWLGWKLGRQYMTDMLGWWSFDGAEAKVTTPFFLSAEGYGGLEVRGGMPLSTPRFEQNGIWRGDRSGFDPSLYPSFQPSDVAPAYGAAVETAGVTWIHGRLDYRRVYNTGSSGVSEFANGLYQPAFYNGTRISSERIGYSLDVALMKIGGLKGGFAYDFYGGRMSTIYASLDAFLSRKFTMSFDYDYYAPVFDGDSIWNFFAGDPMNDLGLRANFDATDHLSVSAAANARIYSVQTSSDNPYNSSPNINLAVTNPNYYPSNGHPFDEGANLAGRYKWGEGNVSLRGAANVGDAGDRVGADLSGERILETRYVFRGRLGVWQWNDKLRPDRDATNLGYVLAVGYRFAPRAQALVDWQHDINRLVGQRFRVMLTLSFAVTK